MLIDDRLPDFDATIIEHIVIDAPRDVVHETARTIDFLQIHSPTVDALMFVRSLPERLGRRFGRRPPAPPPPTMRLADLLDGTTDPDRLEGWLALGEVPGRELVFGAVGKVWQPDIEWRTVAADEFREFAEPDFAKIAAGLSVRDYGRGRTILSYEARTACTSATARRNFLRYWWLVRRFVQIVMRAAVVTIKEVAESAGSDATKQDSPPPEAQPTGNGRVVAD